MAELDILPEGDFQLTFRRIREYLPRNHSILSKKFRLCRFLAKFKISKKRKME